MDLLTEILLGLQKDLSMSIIFLKPVAIQVLAWFFAYELVIGMLYSEAGTNPLLIFKSKIKIWAGLYSALYFYGDLIALIEEAFSYFGSVAIGGGEVPELVKVPSVTLQVGLESLSKLWGYSKLSQPSTWILVVGMIFGLMVFGKIALTVGMVVIEYIVMSSLAIILIPFMMFKKMAFVGDKVLGMLINLNMKILMIRFLIFYFSKFLTKPLNIPEDMDGFAVVEQCFYWLVAMATLGLMTMQGHTLVQTLISGATSFGDASELVSKARAGTTDVLGKTFGKLKGGIGKVHGFGQGLKTGYSSSKNSGAGGISGSVQGTKEALTTGRNARTSHENSYAMGGFFGGAGRGAYNTIKKLRKGDENGNTGNSEQ